MVTEMSTISVRDILAQSKHIGRIYMELLSINEALCLLHCFEPKKKASGELIGAYIRDRISKGHNKKFKHLCIFDRTP